jgi:hypothetical protein
VVLLTTVAAGVPVNAVVVRMWYVRALESHSRQTTLPPEILGSSLSRCELEMTQASAVLTL